MAFFAASIVYLGANTERFQSQWPLAGGIGAVLGTGAASVLLRALGNRGGVLLIGVAFGILQAVALSILWPGGK